MRALSSRPLCSCDGRRVSLGYLSAGLRYTTRWAGVYRVKSRELPTRVKEVIVRFGGEVPSCAERAPGWRLPWVEGLNTAPGVCSLSPSISLGIEKHSL